MSTKIRVPTKSEARWWAAARDAALGVVSRAKGSLIGEAPRALNPMRGPGVERQGFPVAPGDFPFVGHLPALVDDLLGFIRHSEREVGSHFWVRMGFGVEQIMCLTPDALEIFRDRTTSTSLLQDAAGGLLADSMLPLGGDAHRHIRSAMSGPFGPKGLAALDIGVDYAAMIRARVGGWKGQRVPVLAESRELVLALLFRLMGLEPSRLPEWRHQFEEYVLTALDIPIDLPGFPKRRGRLAKEWLDRELGAIVAAERGKAEPSGLIGALVQARDEGGLVLTEAELLGNLRVLVLAGHETTATVLAWMVIELARHPDVWERLVEEATRRELPTSPKQIRELPFSEAVFRETLRLHSPVSFDTRLVTGPLTIGGRTIPVGSWVGVCFAHLSRHPALYDDPESFEPERWLGRDRGATAIESIQFGGGPHFCLGYHLTLFEGVLFAAVLARELSSAGMRPRLEQPYPRTRYMPLNHPAGNPEIVFR